MARRRWPRRIALALLGFVVLVAVGLAMILYIPPLSRLVVSEALTRWDARIPARVEWQAIDGSLGAGLGVEGLAIRDGDGRPLVVVERLELKLRPWSLLVGTAQVDRLALTGVEVWVDHAWVDLSDPDAPPKPAKPGIGPDLPLEIVASITVERGRVWQDEAVLVALGGLDLRARGQGRSAEAELVATEVVMPAEELQVDALALALGWDSPVAVVERLELDSPLVAITRLRGRYDLERSLGQLELDADASLAELARHFEVELGRFGEQASVHLRAEGGPKALELGLELGLGERGELHVHAAGVPTGPVEQRRAGARIRGRLGASLVGSEGVGPLRFDALAQIRGREGAQGFVASVRAEVHEFRQHARLELLAEATAAAFDPLLGEARLELRGAGVELDTQAERDRQGLRARWSLRAVDLGASAPLAAALVDVEALAELRGRVDGEGRCFTPEPGRLDSLECPLELRLRHAAGFGVTLGAARLAARVTPLGDPLGLDASLDVEDIALSDPQLELDRLDVDAHGTLAGLSVDLAARGAHEQLRLAGTLALDHGVALDLDRLRLRSDRGRVPTRVDLRESARIRIADQTVNIEGLSLAAGGGRIDLDGRLGYGPGVASDLDLDVASLRLARLDPLLPGPTLAGVVWLDAKLQGSLAAPELRLHARTRDLQVASVRPGDVDLVVALGRPGRIDTLARDPQVGGLEPAVARLARAEFEALDLDGPGLRVWLRADGPITDRVALVAALPIDLGGGPWLRRGQPLDVRVAIEGLRLVELGGLMPDTPSWWRQTAIDSAAPRGDPKLILQGLVDLDLTLTGTARRPQLAARVRARRLAIDRTPLGSLLAQLRYGDGLAGVELVAMPGFGQLELRGRIPLAVDLARARLDWSATDDRHLVSLDLRSLDLDRLRAALGPKLPALERVPLGGLVSLALRGHGSLAAPELSLALRAGELRHAELELGYVRMFAGYVPGDASVELWIDGPLADRLDARIEAPLELSLLDADEPLRVDLERRASAEIHAHGLSLAALTDVLGGPALSGELSGELELGGPLSRPDLDLRARVDELGRSRAELGDLVLRGRFVDGRARIDLDLVREGRAILAGAAELPVRVALTPTLRDATLEWDRDAHHRVFATGRGIDEALLSALLGESDGRARGLGGRGTDLAFDVWGGGSIDDFEISAEVAGRMRVDEEVTLALDVEVLADETNQRVALALESGRGEGLFGTVELGAEVPGLVTGEQVLGEIPFTLDLRAPGFDLRSIAALLPESVVEPRGLLRADVRGDGRLAAPRLQGQLGIHEGAITVIDMRQRITDIELALDFRDGHIDLDELSLTAGRGGIRADGHAEVVGPDALEATLELAVSDFPVIRPGLPAMVLDTGVDIELRSEPGATRIEVALDEPAVAVAGTTETTPEPIPSSADVVFVHEREHSTAAAEAEPDPGRLALRLELRDPLLITGASIDMAWKGALELEIAGGAVEAGGQLDAERGRLRLFGNRFDLRRGIVTLPDDGSLDPFLDLEAVAALTEAEVTVTVRGRLSRPTLEFSSSPALSEYQILTLLVTGSTEVGEGEGEVAAKAASLLAAVSNPQLQNQLQRSLGIDRATIGFGDTIDQPILTVGKRITRDLYVETSYHHNAPDDQNTTQIAVEYGLRPRWSLESFFGDAAVGGFGVYWTRSFPAPEWSTDLAMPDLQIGD